MRKTSIRGWMIYPRESSSMSSDACRWLQHEAIEEGIELDVLFCEDLACLTSNGKFDIYHLGELVRELPDFAIVRGYDFALMRHIEMMGIKLFNCSSAMLKSLDKFTTHQILTLKGIATPNTLANCLDYKLNVEILGLPFILKDPRGSRGKEVYMIHNTEEFNHHIDELREIVTQQVISKSLGRDIRVWVVGNEAIDAVERFNSNSFKSNFSLGGAAQRVELTQEISHIAVQATKAIGLDFAGVDLLYGENGYIVCEINGNAAFRSIFSIDRNNIIIQQMFRYFRGQIFR